METLNIKNMSKEEKDKFLDDIEYLADYELNRFNKFDIKIEEVKFQDTKNLSDFIEERPDLRDTSHIFITWSGNNGFGNCEYQYNHFTGRWEVDTEYMGLNFARCLLKKLFSGMVEMPRGI